MEGGKAGNSCVPWLMITSTLERNTSGCKNRGASYVFCGLRHNLDNIKSKARILVARVDEDPVPFLRLRGKSFSPTVREGSRNHRLRGTRRKDGGATDKLLSERIPKSSMIVEMNYMSTIGGFPAVLEGRRQTL